MHDTAKYTYILEVYPSFRGGEKKEKEARERLLHTSQPYSNPTESPQATANLSSRKTESGTITSDAGESSFPENFCGAGTLP